MDTYAGSSAAASKLTPFTAAPQTTNASGPASQAAAVAQAAATPAGKRGVARDSSGQPAHNGQSAAAMAGKTSAPTTQTPSNGLVNSVFGSGASTLYTDLYKRHQGSTWLHHPGLTTWACLTNFPVSQFLKFTPGRRVWPAPERGAGRRAVRTLVWPRVADQLGVGEYGKCRHAGRKVVSPAKAGRRLHRLSGRSPPHCQPPGRKPCRRPRSPKQACSAQCPRRGCLGSAIGAGAPTVVANSGVRGRLTPLKDLKRQTVARATEASGRTDIGKAGKRAAPQPSIKTVLTVCSNNLRRNPASTPCICPKAARPKVVPSDAQ